MADNNCIELKCHSKQYVKIIIIIINVCMTVGETLSCFS